jgi:hypothetical protein
MIYALRMKFRHPLTNAEIIALKQAHCAAALRIKAVYSLGVGFSIYPFHLKILVFTSPVCQKSSKEN